MAKRLSAAMYTEGYNVKFIDCIHLPLAGAAGVFFYDNYFYYSFLYGVNRNWHHRKIEKLECEQEFNLNQMGLSLITHEIHSDGDLIETIHSSLDQGKPVYMIVKYNTLFYYKSYNKGDDGEHAIVVSGYEKERGLITIREIVISREMTKNIFRGDAFMPFQITEDILLGIWNNSNRQFNEQNMEYKNKVYSIAKNSTSRINNYMDLMKMFLTDYDLSRSLFVDYLQDFNELIKKQRFSEEYFNILRKVFNGPLTIVFDILEKAFTCIFDRKGYKEAFFNLKTEYMNTRFSILTRLQVDALRNRPVDEEELIAQTQAMDVKLLQLVNDMYAEVNALAAEIKPEDFEFLDLTGYFNNKGFGKIISGKCSAAFTKKGSFLCAEAAPEGKFITIRDCMLLFPEIQEGLKDNLTCAQQEIKVSEAVYSKIVFLGTAEFGHHSGELQIKYKDSKTERLTISFSDLSRNPTFGEDIGWRGKWMQKKDAGGDNPANGEIYVQANTEAFLYVQELKLEHPCEIESIILPAVPNIHIFSISLKRT